MDKFILKATNDTLSDSFQIGFESAKDELESTLFLFVESVLVYLTLKGAWDDIFGRNLEKWQNTPLS